MCYTCRHQIFISTDTNCIIKAVIKGVGGTPWRQVYSNGSILDPFVVSVWVENPGNCAKCGDDSKLVTFWRKQQQVRAVPCSKPTCQLSSGCCVFLGIVSHIPYVWREESHVTYHSSGLLPGPDGDGLWEEPKTKSSRSPCRAVASQRLRRDFSSLIVCKTQVEHRFLFKRRRG